MRFHDARISEGGNFMSLESSTPQRRGMRIPFCSTEMIHDPRRLSRVKKEKETSRVFNSAYGKHREFETKGRISCAKGSSTSRTTTDMEEVDGLVYLSDETVDGLIYLSDETNNLSGQCFPGCESWGSDVLLTPVPSLRSGNSRPRARPPAESRHFFA